MQQMISAIILLWAQSLFLSPATSQCPTPQCLPEHKSNVWKIEDLRLRSLASQSTVEANFTLYRSLSNGESYYTVPSPNFCDDRDSVGLLATKEWKVCKRFNLAPTGEELYPDDRQRLLKWRITEINERPHPQNSSIRAFDSAKFEIVQGILEYV